MNRRRLLCTIGISASVAGCARLSGLRSTGVYTPSISVQADGEDYPDADMSVQVLDQFSEDSPARIAVSYTNTADTERQITVGGSPPFSAYWPVEHDTPQMVLIPDDRAHFSKARFIASGGEQVNTPYDSDDQSKDIVPDEPVNGCWRVRESFVIWQGTNDITLSPDETITQRYTMLAQRDADTCLPTGSYRFEQRHYFGRDQPWGFIVRVSRE